MTLPRKHFALAILMALLIGHFGMAVHATTHTIGEASECELCLSYNDSSETLAAMPDLGVVPARESTVIADTRDVSEKRGWAPYLQRDPPVST